MSNCTPSFGAARGKWGNAGAPLAAGCARCEGRRGVPRAARPSPAEASVALAASSSAWRVAQSKGTIGGWLSEPTSVVSALHSARSNEAVSGRPMATARPALRGAGGGSTSTCVVSCRSGTSALSSPLPEADLCPSDTRAGLAAGNLLWSEQQMTLVHAHAGGAWPAREEAACRCQWTARRSCSDTLSSLDRMRSPVPLPPRAMRCCMSAQRPSALSSSQDAKRGAVASPVVGSARSFERAGASDGGSSTLRRTPFICRCKPTSIRSQGGVAACLTAPGSVLASTLGGAETLRL